MAFYSRKCATIFWSGSPTSASAAAEAAISSMEAAADATFSEFLLSYTELARMSLRNALTNCGSNCDPAQRSSSVKAWPPLIACL